MGKTFHYEKIVPKRFKKNSPKYSEVISPRVFYNKLDVRGSRRKQLAKKRRTTYK